MRKIMIIISSICLIQIQAQIPKSKIVFVKFELSDIKEVNANPGLLLTFKEKPKVFFCYDIFKVELFPNGNNKKVINGSILYGEEIRSIIAQDTGPIISMNKLGLSLSYEIKNGVRLGVGYIEGSVGFQINISHIFQ